MKIQSLASHVVYHRGTALFFVFVVLLVFFWGGGGWKRGQRMETSGRLEKSHVRTATNFTILVMCGWWVVVVGMVVLRLNQNIKHQAG